MRMLSVGEITWRMRGISRLAPILSWVFLFAGPYQAANAGYIMVDYEDVLEEFCGFPAEQYVTGFYIFDENAANDPPHWPDSYAVIHMEMTVGGVRFVANRPTIRIVDEQVTLTPNQFQDRYGARGETTGIFKGNLEVFSFGVGAESYAYGNNPSISGIDLVLSLEDMHFSTYRASISFTNLDNGKPCAVDGFNASLKFTRINTITGELVDVVPETVDANGEPVEGGPLAAVRYTNVTHGGNTSFVVGTEGPRVPFGWRLGNPGIFMNLSTTATFTGTVSLCIDMGFLEFSSNTDQLKLLLFSDVGWVDITTEVLPETHCICGSTDTQGLMAIVQPADPVEMLKELIATVDGLDAGKGVTNSLGNMLDKALKYLTDSKDTNDSMALRILTRDFIRQVENKSGKQLLPADAELLLYLAREIAAVLESGY